MAANEKDSRIITQKDTIIQLKETVRSQNELIDSLRTSVDSCNATIANLNEQVAYLTKKLFGTSSEKRGICAGQLNLFDEVEQEAAAIDLPIPEVPAAKPVRKSRRTAADTFKGIPVRKEIITLSDAEKFCPDCETPLERIGEELVRKEFRFTPAKGEIVAFYTETYKCPECTNGNTPEKSYEFVKSKAPDPLIPHSYASASAVAWAVYQKYANAMPLYRQEKDWRQLGADLSRATLANWIIFCAETYFAPMYEFFHRLQLKRKFLMADETRVQVLKEKGRSAESDSYMWLLRTGEDGLPPILIYRYTQTRARYNVKELLTGFEGYLQTDGYQGYNDLPGIKRCCCWAHVRRYFLDAVPKGKEYDYSNPAVQGVQFCGKLFEHERFCKEKQYTYEQRHEYRNQKSKPLLAAFFAWLEAQNPVRGSRFDKAVTYAKNRKEYLVTFLEDGRCSLSNNLSENAIRPFTIGRKNWLFSDSAKGAYASAVVYTMVEMAKAHTLNIFKYLNYLLEQRLNIDMPDAVLETLAPWCCDVIDRCANYLE
ncbi:MAG: IS66 family transposase [Clostridiales bacterium]|nr:IS66 family transposase [Clostridiales bacterium]